MIEMLAQTLEHVSYKKIVGLGSINEATEFHLWV
jgi:hypothetical protein